MKLLLSFILLLSNHVIVCAQQAGKETFLQTSRKSHLYYISIQDAYAVAYKMGYYWDLAGTGYSILMTDTLSRQASNDYIGRDLCISQENHKLYILNKSGKGGKYRLDTADDFSEVKRNLNNAYFLDHYFTMNHTLNARYPLSHHSFRYGYYTWESLHNQELEHSQFRKFTDSLLSNIMDSIISVQDHYTALTDYLVRNIAAIEYAALKDSLRKLPAEYKPVSGYYETVVSKLAEQRPADFLQLAEDFCQYRYLIFSIAENDHSVIQGLKNVHGHNEIKKEFFKERRNDKLFIIRVIGTYAAVGGLVVFLIVRH